MKNYLFLVSFAIFAIIPFVGCSTTPKLVGPPVVIGSTNYTVAQPPLRLEVENKGRQWNQFVREYNAERLEHNLRQAQIENRGAEQNRAKELGVPYTPPALGQQPQTVPVGNGGVHYYTPYLQYPASGGYGRQFFGTPTYFYTPYSGGYGYGSGTYMYGGAGTYGNLGGNCQPRGKLSRWLTQSQSSPGYRHTGGPVTVIQQHSIGGVAVGGAGFTSGLHFYTPR